MVRAKSVCSWATRVLITAAIMSAVVMAERTQAASENGLTRCRTLSDDTAKLRCFESLTLQPSQNGPARPQIAPADPKPFSNNSENSSSHPIGGKWRLVRTPTHRDGEEVVSIMATAEISGSDIDFAGLNLRCADPDFEILVFLIRPLPPQAQPVITVNGKTFEGSVVSPGTAIRLPKEAADLATGQWQTLPNLSIKVENDGTTTRGLISLDGFDVALKTLISACLAR